ncbi:MAG: hypothetical protein GXO92_01000 [FCB group bacterium]|nr:hypothetical protein [FCB group bacterium]
MKFDQKTYRLTDTDSIGLKAFIIGDLAILLSLYGYFSDTGQFFHSYLTAFTFWTTLSLGALFFLLVHYLAGSVWCIVFRRIAEALAANLPYLAIFSIPVLLGIGNLYHWSDPQVVAADHLLQKKSAFLNVPFFTIRTIAYFLIWSITIFLLYRNSLRQDIEKGFDLQSKLRRVSAIGMVLFALTLTFASFDWLMSLDPHWYSTIFGVYIFAGTYLIILSFLALFSLFLRHYGVLKETITIKHYHDLGRLIFAFTVFWAYIAGSQYFLIWYGNVPEETVWFLQRWEGSWKYLSLILVFGHFAIPFLALLFRAAKRNLKVLGSVAGLLIVMHFIDLYWIVLPSLHSTGVQFSWLDLTTFIGIGGILLGLFWKRLVSRSLIPVNSPRLSESVKYTDS